MNDDNSTPQIGALSALMAGQVEEAGYVVVPAEPTERMLSAAQSAWLNDPARRSSTLYRAMLKAAQEDT